MDGWELAFKYAVAVLGTVVTILVAICGWLARSLSNRVDACVTHEDLEKLLKQQAEAETLRTQIQLNMHAQNSESLKRFIAMTGESFERIEKKIDNADQAQKELSTAVAEIKLSVAVLSAPRGDNPPPRFNHNR